MSFDHKQVEAKWKQKWAQDRLYATPDVKDDDDKCYVLDMYPYPSGAGLHVGHVEGYTATDIIARYMRMRGKKVLHPMGWDSFGLPAENYAIKTGVHPDITTNEAIDTFKSQIDNLGLSYDWNRELGSHTEEYYRWTQWLFLKLYERGLAYQKEAPVNWCPTDNTVLANEQVIDGVCERCDTEVIQKNMKQWFFKITDYADRLLADLDKLDWPESTKAGQRNWIGRKEGINITYKVDSVNSEVTVFTTRPDTNFGATFIVVAPDSNFVKENQSRFKNTEAVNKYIEKSLKKTELERLQEGKKKTGVFTGLYAINQLNNKKLPIYISDFVLTTVGTGAVVGVPGHDVRDFEFAKAMGIDIVRVVVSKDGDTSPITSSSQVQEEEGVMINSDFLDGMQIQEATSSMMDHLEEKGFGKRVVSYRLRDWLAVRQRYWGCPTPIVYDPDGNPHPADEAELPILLPRDVDFKPTGQSPLVDSVSFHKSAEERYGTGWTREVDTLDTFVDSSWYFFRFTDSKNDTEFASAANINKWMPVDLYVGGAEHTVLHLLYARFFTKFLFDEGIIDFDEPFQKLRHPGMILAEDGRKMSKRWGNVINPDDEIERFGADTVRIYEMFMGPFKDSKPWSTRTEEGVYRFLNRIWNLQDHIGKNESNEQEVHINQLIRFAGNGIESMSFNTVVSKFMEFVNYCYKEVIANGQKIDRSVWERFLKVIAPYAPFISEELWSLLEHKQSIHAESWPVHDEKLLVQDTVTIGIQVNGKVRSEITISANATKAEAEQLALNDSNIKKWLASGTYKKFIYVPGKIINIVI